MLSFWMALARDIAANARPVFATCAASSWNAASDIRRTEFPRRPAVAEAAYLGMRDCRQALPR